MPAVFPAHIRVCDGDKVEAVQLVKEHCTNAAGYAGDSLRDAQLSSLAYLAGLLHDMGKYTEAFKSYIEAYARGDKSAVRGSVNHTFAAVRYLLGRYHAPNGPAEDAGRVLRNLACELTAYAAGAHHGLFDCVDEGRRSGFCHRLQKEGIAYEEAVGNFLAQCAGEAEIDRLFSAAVPEVGRAVEALQPLLENDETGAEGDFYLGMLARLLLSAVIEGDRRDTAEFMQGRAYPPFPEGAARQRLWAEALARVETRLLAFPNDKPIQQARRAISGQCRAFAERPGGVYRLNVPTGAGKTLSALRYALAHAAKWNKARIIITSPLLSILEQNAGHIRDYVQDDSIILEHHSNVVQAEAAEDELDDRELLTENWQSPIILTTLVQLLDTLFKGKATCIRRFQALCGSVIVIDEVQTVPNKMLTLFNLAVNFLSTVCGATVVLCSATQPCLERAAHPLYGLPQEMVPYDAGLWLPFRRTSLQDGGGMRLEEIPAFAASVLEEANSLLIVCNKKDEAETIYRAMGGEGRACFHLSAAMCVAHRRDVLRALEAALEASKRGGAKTVCVSTQVIEAGVDISFGRVIRLAAGMDNVVQSAGRCNRNGESQEPAPVYTVLCSDENLRRLTEIQRAKDATLELLREYRRDPRRFGGDLASDSAIGYYYRRLYAAMPAGFQDDTVQVGQKKLTVFSLLSSNAAFADEDCPAAGRYLLNQAFKLAGQAFTVFDNDTTDVLVPYRAGEGIILELGDLDPVRDAKQMKRELDKAKPYTVSLYQYQKEKLEAQHALVPKCNGSVLVLQEDYYDAETGLTMAGGQLDFKEV